MNFKTQAEEVSHWRKFAADRGGSRVWNRKADAVQAMTVPEWARHNYAEEARMAAAAPFVPAAVAAMAAQLRRKAGR